MNILVNSEQLVQQWAACETVSSLWNSEHPWQQWEAWTIVSSLGSSEQRWQCKQPGQQWAAWTTVSNLGNSEQPGEWWASFSTMNSHTTVTGLFTTACSSGHMSSLCWLAFHSELQGAASGGTKVYLQLPKYPFEGALLGLSCWVHRHYLGPTGPGGGGEPQLGTCRAFSLHFLGPTGPADWDELQLGTCRAFSYLGTHVQYWSVSAGHSATWAHTFNTEV